jgi:hypothetical protein
LPKAAAPTAAGKVLADNYRILENNRIRKNPMTEAIQTTPAPIETKIPFASATNPAVARCVWAWIRARKAERAKGSDRYDTKKAADSAYLDALPPLSGDENIRDFIAWVTQAMLADIIMESSGSKLLYAAQVAYMTSRGQSKAPKSAV